MYIIAVLWVNRTPLYCFGRQNMDKALQDALKKVLGQLFSWNWGFEVSDNMQRLHRYNLQTLLVKISKEGSPGSWVSASRILCWMMWLASNIKTENLSNAREELAALCAPRCGRDLPVRLCISFFFSSPCKLCFLCATKSTCWLFEISASCILTTGSCVAPPDKRHTSWSLHLTALKTQDAFKSIGLGR